MGGAAGPRDDDPEPLRAGALREGDEPVRRAVGRDDPGLVRDPELVKRALSLTLDERRNAVDIEATCKLKGRTGVEMEALTAASVAALTVYDMCKAVDRGMVIAEVRLQHKSGGKSGTWNA